MSFQQGLSGLNAASKSLETIGNNVANANTVGFKGSSAQFADVYANSLTGAGSSQVGIGTKVAQVSQQFTQGNVSSSNNPLDLAINGGGFFRLSSAGVVSFSRNGQFQMDQEGYIVNPGGARLTGYNATANGALTTGAPQEININTADLPPRRTAATEMVLNFDSRLDVPSVGPVDLSDPRTYSDSSSLAVYDSLGNSHLLQTFYVKTATPGEWSIYATLDGQPFTFDPPVPPAVDPTVAPIGSVTFDSNGFVDTAATTMPLNLSIDLNAVLAANGDVNNATSPLAFSYDLTGSTQFGSNFGTTTQYQDGFASGRLSGFDIGADGIISGRYTNGKQATLGQVVLANFTNPNGLQPLGNNLWAESAASGSPLVGVPNSGTLGVLQSMAVEESNVDLTAELVNMITAQRFYQANAQTIKTQDQVLQTLVNLR